MIHCRHSSSTQTPHVCVVWEYTSTDFQQAKLCRKCLCSVTRAQNGLFVTCFLWVFSYFFSSAPSRVLFDFVSYLWGWVRKFNQVVDHMDLGQLKHVTHIVAVTEPPMALSKSLQVALYILILKLGKDALITNPVYWPCALWYLDKKQDREGYRMNKGKPWWIRAVQRKKCLGQMLLRDPSDPQIFTPLLWNGATTLI